MADPSQMQFRQGGLKKAAVSGWLWNFLINSATLVVTSLVFLFTSRLLDPESFGTVAFAAAVVAMISAVMPVAFGDALVQRKVLEERHVNTVFWLCIMTGAVAYGGLMLAAPLIAAQQEAPQIKPILYILGSRLLFDAVNTSPSALLKRRMAFRTLAIRSVLGNLVGAAACFLLIYLGYPLWGLVLSQALAPLVAMVVVVQATRWRPTGFFDRGALQEIWGFGLSALGINALNQARVEQLLFGLMLGPAMLGLYFFARRVTEILTNLFAGAFGGVGGVVFATLQSDAVRRRDAFKAASFASTSLGFPVFAGLFVLAPTAVPLVFGQQWEGAIIMIQALSVTGLMSSLGIIQAALVRYLGEAAWWFRYQLLTRVTGWIIILVMAPLGATVVVIAMAARTFLIWPLSVRKTAQLAEIRFVEYVASFAAPTLASLTMAGWVAVLPRMLPEAGPWTILVAQISSGALVYALLLAVLARNRMAEALEFWRMRKGARA